MHFFALLCTPLHSYALPVGSAFYPCTPNWECIIFFVLCTPRTNLKNIYFYHFFWFWECIIFLTFMHSQISKTFSISIFGSGSAWFCSFLCTPRFSKLFLLVFLVLGVHDFAYFYALPDFQFFSISFFGSGSAWFCSFLCTPRFPKLFLWVFLVLGVHDFAHFYALPDFQNFFY